MTGNNGHAPKRFAETRSRASCAFKGVLGALPRQAEGSFRGGENSLEMQKSALFALLATFVFNMEDRRSNREKHPASSQFPVPYRHNTA